VATRCAYASGTSVARDSPVASAVCVALVGPSGGGGGPIRPRGWRDPSALERQPNLDMLMVFAWHEWWSDHEAAAAEIFRHVADRLTGPR
jgi:hypothetical protein